MPFLRKTKKCILRDMLAGKSPIVLILFIDQLKVGASEVFVARRGNLLDKTPLITWGKWLPCHGQWIVGAAEVFVARRGNLLEKTSLSTMGKWLIWPGHGQWIVGVE